MFLPEEDRHSLSKRMIVSQMCTMFGGRVAEELVLGEEGITTGASNDIQQASKMARNMVTKWGLSEKLGPLMYSEEEEEVFLGMSAGNSGLKVSDSTARIIDEEVRSVIDSCHETARRLLNENLDKLHAMSDALLTYETIDHDQIVDIMSGREPRPPKDWGDTGPTPLAPSGDDLPESDPRPSGPVGDPAGEH